MSEEKKQEQNLTFEEALIVALRDIKYNLYLNAKAHMFAAERKHHLNAVDAIQAVNSCVDELDLATKRFREMLVAEENKE